MPSKPLGARSAKTTVEPSQRKFYLVSDGFEQGLTTCLGLTWMDWSKVCRSSRGRRSTYNPLVQDNSLPSLGLYCWEGISFSRWWGGEKDESLLTLALGRWGSSCDWGGEMRGLPGVLHHCCSTFLKYIYSCLNLGNLISYMIYGPIMDREADNTLVVIWSCEQQW